MTKWNAVFTGFILAMIVKLFFAQYQSAGLLIVGFILTGIILGITISAGVANISRANELKEIEYENSQEIEFGKFMRENNPKTWSTNSVRYAVSDSGDMRSLVFQVFLRLQS